MTMPNEQRHACSRIGEAVYCTTCGLRKTPRGRSAPLGMANGLCDFECSGYREEPRPGSLWPGEACVDFGYIHSTDATREMTAEEISRWKEARDAE